jgi:hypothetical protein
MPMRWLALLCRVGCGLHGGMDGVDGYEPKRPHWRGLWKRLSPQSRARRYAAALKREEVLKTVTARPAGESERAAVQRLAGSMRSNLRRWQTR